jgi:hypothetical protein
LFRYALTETVLPYRARICKRLRRPGIDSKESIPPAYVACRAGTSKRGCRTGRPGCESIPGLLKIRAPYRLIVESVQQWPTIILV